MQTHLTAQQLVAEAENRHDLQEVGGLQRVLQVAHVQDDFGRVDELNDAL